MYKEIATLAYFKAIYVIQQNMKYLSYMKYLCSQLLGRDSNPVSPEFKSWKSGQNKNTSAVLLTHHSHVDSRVAA
jgi:hypothetical protein